MGIKAHCCLINKEIIMNKLTLPIKPVMSYSESYDGISKNLLNDLTSLYGKYLSEILEYIYKMDNKLSINEVKHFGDGDFSVKKLPMGLVFESHCSGWWGCIISYDFKMLIDRNNLSENDYLPHEVWIFTYLDNDGSSNCYEKSSALKNKYERYMSDFGAERMLELDSMFDRTVYSKLLNIRVSEFKVGERYSHNIKRFNCANFKFPLIPSLKDSLKEWEEEGEE